MSYRILVLMAILLCMPVPAHAQTIPSFNLLFVFDPPAVSRTGIAPIITLEVCADPACRNVAGAITLQCIAVKNSDEKQLFLSQCSTTGNYTQAGPDVTMRMLDRPSVLRLMINALRTPPFPFIGGAANIPPNTYLFKVVTRNGGVTVEPQ